MDLRIRQLQSFLTLAELLHYGQSARALHMSQPTMTFQIKGLEETFGAALFVRDRHGVRLTAAGEAFRSYAQSIVATVSAASERLEAMRGRQRLRVSASPLGQQLLLPSLLRMLAARHSGLELEVRQLTTEQKLSQLQTGEVDALLMVREPALAGVEFVGLCEKPLVAMVARDCGQAARRSLSVEEARDVPLIVPQAADSAGQREFLTRMLGEYGIVPRVVEVPESCAVQLAYVAGGKGMVIAGRCGALELHPEVVALPFRERLPALRFGLASMYANENPALNVLRRVVQDCLVAATERERAVRVPGVAVMEQRLEAS